VVKDAEETHANYMALTTTCDITQPDQHKLSKTKISTFSKGLQENLVNPALPFCMIYVNTLQSFFLCTVCGTTEI